jgi:hypothetical protein
MAAEIMYIHDLEVEALIPGLIASIVGYSVYGAFFGYSPIFGAQTQLIFDHPVQLLYFAALGILCGLVGILYARSFYAITGAFHRLNLPKWFKPAIGGVLVGLMGIFLPGALHMGYGWVQLLLASVYSGAFHPSAEGHAVIADATFIDPRHRTIQRDPSGKGGLMDHRERGANRAKRVAQFVRNRRGKLAERG